MDGFYVVPVCVAAVVLVVTLAIVGIMMWRDKVPYVFPPVLTGCPSPGWNLKTDASGNKICVPKNPAPPGMDGSCAAGFPYIGSQSDLAVCQALACAKRCNVPWDGITGDPSIAKACKDSRQSCELIGGP